jgi:hypothetical protein
MRSLQAQWESYRAAVVPKDAGLVQIEECRRAFYAGAASALHITMSVSDIEEAAAVAVLEGLRQECLTFVNTVHPQPGAPPEVGRS